MQILDRQLPIDEKKLRADYIISNEDTLEKLEKNVTDFIKHHIA